MSPKWIAAGSQRRMAGRGAKAPEFSPCGVAPFLLEGRFNALDQDSEAATLFSWHVIDSDVSFNQGMEGVHSQGRAILGTGEGTTSDRECSDSPKLGERLVDLHWPLGSLVKWKSPDHPGFLNMILGLCLGEQWIGNG